MKKCTYCDSENIVEKEISYNGKLIKMLLCSDCSNVNEYSEYSEIKIYNKEELDNYNKIVKEHKENSGYTEEESKKLNEAFDVLRELGVTGTAYLKGYKKNV